MPKIFDQFRAGLITASAEETKVFAAAFAAMLPTAVTLALHGDLGVGKTTFVQGLARGFDITATVTSPTFNIYTVHRGPRRTLVHLDAYRLERPAEIEALLLEDFLVPPWCLAIEWPEKTGAWLPPDAWHLDLGIAPDQRHTLRLR